MGLSISCIINIGLDIISMKRKYEYKNLSKVNKWNAITYQEQRNQKDIASENYTIKQPLGTGYYGIVYLCQNNITHEEVAIKCIKKNNDKNHQRYTIAELSSLIKLKDKHECIIKYIDSFQSSKNIYFVIEYVKNSCELFDKIIDIEYFLEYDARIIMSKLLSCIKTIHSYGIIHNDLKPENILISKKNGKFIVKVIDFGLSKYDQNFAKTNELKTYHTKDGTPFYIAPEVLNKKYTRTCDLWSCGVIMYILLCGSPPFTGNDDSVIFQKIKTQDVTFSHKVWKIISDEAIDLIKQLLNRDSINRISAEDALNHKWFDLIM